MFFQEFSSFRSLILLELIFAYGVRVQFFFLLHVDIQFSRLHLLTRSSFPHSVCLAPVLKLFNQTYESPFLGSVFYSTGLSLRQDHTVLITVTL